MLYLKLNEFVPTHEGSGENIQFFIYFFSLDVKRGYVNYCYFLNK